MMSEYQNKVGCSQACLGERDQGVGALSARMPL